MTTEYSVSVEDWQDEKWRFVGREIEESVKGEWSEDNQDGVDADDYYPMMLYAYPLSKCPDNEIIQKIHDKTNLTVVENTDTEEFFLALTGGGMDLSQDIAMAYIITENYIPPALAFEVSTQEGLSQHGKDWVKVMRVCKQSLVNHASAGRFQAKKIAKAMREYRLRDIEHLSSRDMASVLGKKKSI